MRATTSRSSPPPGDIFRLGLPKLEMWPRRKLRLSKRNARMHSKQQCEQLFAAIRRFGFINPIIIDEHGNVIAGHLRLKAAAW